MRQATSDDMHQEIDKEDRVNLLDILWGECDEIQSQEVQSQEDP